MKRDLEIAEDLFSSFHSFKPKKIDTMASGFKIPKELHLVGQVISISYQSNKWGKKADYIHHASLGVNLYLKKGIGPKFSVPSWIYKTDSLVRLGLCLGYEYEDESGEIVITEASSPLPELFSVPSGKSLLIIEDRLKVHGVLWGGGLNVKPEGIVG